MKKSSPSLRLFKPYISRGEDGEVDASQLLSRACYLGWLRAKSVAQESDDEAKRFLRTLTNHVSGTDGRCPFEEDEERAILHLLRARNPWPCFPAHLSHFGRRYRGKGFHERQRQAQALATAQTHDETCQNNILAIFSALPPADADFLRSLCAQLMSSLGSEFDLEARGHLCEVVRFTILARTNRLRTETSASASLQLCDEYSALNLPAWILDITATLHWERIAAQNAEAGELLGDLTLGNLESLALAKDIPRVFLAVMAAYFRPGVDFPVTHQELHCGKDGELRWFDMRYRVDPESFLLVIYGLEEGGS